MGDARAAGSVFAAWVAAVLALTALLMHECHPATVAVRPWETRIAIEGGDHAAR